MSSMLALRSRLFVAMGLSSAALIACGGDADSSNQGVGGGSSGTSGMSGAAGMAAGGAAGGSAGSAGAAGMAAGGSSGTAGAGGNGGFAGSEFCQPWPSCATVRRPFLVGADMRSSVVAERDDWAHELPSVHIAHARTAEFLAASWLKDALEEHASIAAFARFTLLLLSVGAPPELVIASQRASLDEVRHARECFALAQRYGSRHVGPAELQVADSISVVTLAELAALNVAEGCVGETLGALLAAEQLTRASDQEVRRVLARVVKDEERHAELAWRFLAWALRQGGPPVAEAAQRAFAAATEELDRMPTVDYGVDVDVWHAHGRVTCAEARTLSRAGIREVIAPCLRALLEQSSVRESTGGPGSSDEARAVPGPATP
ncbi:MAG TPA: ferritin-like domain-containing protein [Polyangiaceae bacterium]